MFFVETGTRKGALRPSGMHTIVKSFAEFRVRNRDASFLIEKQSLFYQALAQFFKILRAVFA